MNNEELTWQQKALTGISNEPLLAVAFLIWFADKFELAGHLSIADCKPLHLQLHVFHILKMELETNTSHHYQPSPPCQAPAAIPVLWFNH